MGERDSSDEAYHKKTIVGERIWRCALNQFQTTFDFEMNTGSIYRKFRNQVNVRKLKLS